MFFLCLPCCHCPLALLPPIVNYQLAEASILITPRSLLVGGVETLALRSLCSTRCWLVHGNLQGRDIHAMVALLTVGRGWGRRRRVCPRGDGDLEEGDREGGDLDDGDLKEGDREEGDLGDLGDDLGDRDLGDSDPGESDLGECDLGDAGGGTGKC